MRIHILAICGSKTTPLAVLLKQQGHQVSGSDQEKIYPPFSDLLDQHHIPVNTTTIDKAIDLVIVGNAYHYFQRCQEELALTQQLHLPYCSYTQYLVDNLIKQNSILVAGSYGKTTITGLLSHIFLSLHLDPSYMVAGELINQTPPTRLGQSSWSIVEADENHNGLDTIATFLYYPVKYLILTSTAWEHKDSYATADENRQTYQKLVAKVPTNGFIVFNPHDPDIYTILKSARCPTIPYLSAPPKSSLIGRYNQENVTAAYTLCQHLGLNVPQVKMAITSFLGIKRRLQVLGQTQGIMFIDDFAQSPVRVEAVINALHQQFPGKRIFVYFEPHASFLMYKTSLLGLGLAFQTTQQVIVSRITYSPDVSKSNRASASDYRQEIGPKCLYIPLNVEIVSYFTNLLKKDDILVHFSSGGLDGLKTLHQIIKTFT